MVRNAPGENSGDRDKASRRKGEEHSKAAAGPQLKASKAGIKRREEARVQDGGQEKVLGKSSIHGKNFVFKKVPQEDRA